MKNKRIKLLSLFMSLLMSSQIGVCAVGNANKDFSDINVNEGFIRTSRTTDPLAIQVIELRNKLDKQEGNLRSLAISTKNHIQKLESEMQRKDQQIDLLNGRIDEINDRLLSLLDKSIENTETKFSKVLALNDSLTKSVLKKSFDNSNIAMKSNESLGKSAIKNSEDVVVKTVKSYNSCYKNCKVCACCDSAGAVTAAMGIGSVLLIAYNIISSLHNPMNPIMNSLVK